MPIGINKSSGDELLATEVNAIVSQSNANEAAIATEEAAREAHEARTDNPHAVTKAQVGLPNVDNTSDMDKPVSTAQQSALDFKTDKNIQVNTQAGGSYVLVLTDNNKTVETNNASANTVTVPPNSSVPYPIGAQILITQYGEGQTSFVAGSGVTIRQREDKLKIAGQYGVASLIKRGTDEWYLTGDLTA